MKVQEIDGVTYTQIEKDIFQDSNGGEWPLWERPDMISKIRWAEKEMTRLAGRLEGDEDAASAYLQALEIKTETEADLEIIEALWNL